MLSTISYQNLIEKIEGFIKKYYLNKIIKGFIWFVAVFLFCSLILIVTEYYGYFNITIKTIAFYTFIALHFVLIYFFVGKNVLKYLKFGKRLDLEAASEIIGQHFPEINDKLLNTLQLKKQSYNESQANLIEASISQKITALKSVTFVSAIKLNHNNKYLKYVIVPVLAILLIGLIAPAILNDGTKRFINHNQVFFKPAPFSFEVKNKNLQVLQGNNYKLNIKIRGTQVPQDVYLEDGANVFKLDKKGIINFSYTFNNLQNNHKFRLMAAGIYSKEFELLVFKKPAILNFEVYLNYPNYTKKQNETLKNPSDLTFAAGTTLTWKIRTENSNQLNFVANGKKKVLNPFANNNFTHSQRFTKSQIYSLIPQTKTYLNTENISFKLNCVADEYPTVSFADMPDSINPKIVYFNGKITDDYGFLNLKFNYRIIKSEDKNRVNILKSTSIKINNNYLNESFFYSWDLNLTNIKPNEEIEYYFTVTDNDGVNGPKTVKSALKIYKTKSKNKEEENLEQNTKTITQKLQQAANQAKEIQKQAQKINQSLLSKTKLDFEDKKNAEDLIEKQKQLENLLNDLQKEAQKNLVQQKNLNPQNQQLLEKQKQIKDLFENVLDDKTKKLLQNLQKLLDQKNKEETRENLQQIKMDNKSLEKEFDRMLALYKQLALDQKLDNTINKLKDIAKTQDLLSKQVDKNDLLEKQENLQKEFSQIKKDLKTLEQENKENDPNSDFKNPEADQQEIEKEMQESQKSLQQKQEKAASKQQKSVAEKMDKLADKLSSMQSESQEEEKTVNAEQLKTLLKNTLKASFDEEALLNLTLKTDINDSKFIQLGKNQKNIGVNLKTIQDSLFSLSKLVPQISAAVNKETQNINYQITKSLEFITERKQAETLQSQQHVLTSVNNLALMLGDALQSMQNSMGKGKSGKGKPKPNMQQLSKMQQELNKNMQKAKQQLDKQGGLNPGQKPGQQQGGVTSKAFSQMAQQQQMIREAMENLNKDGFKMPGGLEKTLQSMQQTEAELVYKKISQDVLKRQQQIETKLLEAATAEREREQDNKKESTAAKEFMPNYNVKWQQYQKQMNVDLEILKSISPALNPFYKQKLTYFYNYLNITPNK
ncbi:MAG: hypothetical protein EAZ15_04140 [Sphingobacteriales bacterium]|nr:MAG: hypothetical protein EAZ15_04140 [Sphingobacteriales bacterium]